MTKVEDHVLSYLEDYTTVPELLKTISGCGYQNDTYYNKCKAFVEGGGFLIWFNDIIEEVASWTGTKTDKKGREYTGSEAWDLYIHLISKYLEKRIYKFVQDKKYQYLQEKLY